MSPTSHPSSVWVQKVLPPVAAQPPLGSCQFLPNWALWCNLIELHTHTHTNTPFSCCLGETQPQFLHWASAADTGLGCATLCLCKGKKGRKARRQKATSSHQGMMWAYTVGFTVLPHVGGFLGWFMSQKGIPVWYEKLKKPSWCPPLKILPVAWTVLYTGMGYASYLVWNDLGGCSSKAVLPLGLYGAQLALNWAWPHLFFRTHNLKMALIDILCLDVLTIGTMCSWYRINKVAALLLVPYLGWLAMTTCLSIRIWKDNPEQKSGKSE